MNILCLDTPIDDALSRMGHEVRAVRTSPGSGGVADILQILETRNFWPDCVIQGEALHERTLLRNLDRLDCLKVFWAMDSHLNICWHKYYSRLFDVVCTPHLSFFAAMPPEWTPPQLLRLARPGHDLPFRPHGERPRPLGFVGVDLPRARPLRHRFFELLAPFGLERQSDLTPRDMLEFYANTRIVPNESIAFEVNFRLTEAASAGACVLSPDLGEDQDALFQPGREMTVYRDGLELRDKVSWLLTHGEEAEKIALAAWRRVRSSHLPEHRAASLLRGLDDCGDRPSRSSSAMALAMTLAQRGRYLGHAPPRSLIASLENRDHPEAMALSLRCLCEWYPGDEAEYKVLACLGDPALSASRDILLVCLAYALRREDLKLFCSFWALWHMRWPHSRLEQPLSLYEACLRLADLLQRARRHFQPGFRFDPERMLPESAFEALQLARLHAGEDREWAKRLASLTSKSKALTQVRQEALELTLGGLGGGGAAYDWRTRLDYALVSLEAYDVHKGLTQLRKAGEDAAAQGRAGLFDAIVTAKNIRM